MHDPDIEAAAFYAFRTTSFYALSHLSSGLFAKDPLQHRREAGALLEKLMERAPKHPGAIHYLIHAYDDTALASRGVDAARAYDVIAPDAPHALHMPSHIFVRLGMWEEDVAWNRRSAAAALRLPKIGGLVSNHYPHALDYLVHALLQRGEDEAARAAADALANNGDYESEQGVAFALAAVPARDALERRRWTEAAELPVRSPDSFPWNDYPGIEAVSWHARGLGAARSGRSAVAREAIDALDTLHQRVAGRSSECDWGGNIDAQGTTIAAWLAFDDDPSAALEQMKRAAEIENGERSCTGVEWIMTVPAIELLGDMYAELESWDDALRVYEEALARLPNRHNSLYGAGRSAEEIGDSEKARTYYRHLLDIVGDAGADRETVRAARNALSPR